MKIKGKINIKRGEDQIWSHFWLEQNVKRKRGEEKRKRKKKKEEPRKVWISIVLYGTCMDMLWKLLGYGLLGFSMDFWVLDLAP